MWPQPALVALTDTAAQGPISHVTRVTLWLVVLLTVAVTLEVHGHGQAVFETHGLDGKCLHPLCRAASHFGFYGETHLQDKASFLTKRHRALVQNLHCDT